MKGTHDGAVTDMDGRFSLNNVPKNATLIITYVGFTAQEVTWKGSPLKITLSEDQQSLNEVVVVGYGTQKKVNLSGSVAQINGKSLDNRPINNVTSGLQGLMPGITITGTAGAPGMDGGSIRVRGVGTLNNASPYILVDGVETSNINSLDP